MQALHKISIVTPTYNQGQYIEQTIQSVLDQGYGNLEYIIIDGGSSDETVGIIKKYEKYLAYWVSEKDRGQSHAINKGLALCTGNIFNWINSDDYYEGKVFQKINEIFSNPETMMCSGASRVFGGDKEWISEGTRLPDDKKNYWPQPVIDQPATFFRMNTVRELGYLNEKLHYTMDLAWLLKFWLKNGTTGMLKINEVFVNFREHPGSKTVNFQERFVNERIWLYRDLLILSGNIKGVSEYLINEETAINIPSELIIKITNQYVYEQLLVSYGKRDFKRFNDIEDLFLVNFSDIVQKKEFIKMKKRKAVFQKIPAFMRRKLFKI